MKTNTRETQQSLRTWEAEHVPLSVSVCSNVPGYDEPKCFVSSGNTREMIKQFIDHLVQIRQESYANQSTNGKQ
jgi:hypothetical protein